MKLAKNTKVGSLPPRGPQAPLELPECASQTSKRKINQQKATKASNASNASEASITHLELRSPMFGETCISKSMSEFEVVFSFYVVFR